MFLTFTVSVISISYFFNFVFFLFFFSVLFFFFFSSRRRHTRSLCDWSSDVCSSDLNFPLALSTGMSAAALVAGNTVVYKPAEDAPWTGLELYEVYRDAGVPAGAFNYLPGTGERSEERRVGKECR